MIPLTSTMISRARSNSEVVCGTVSAELRSLRIQSKLFVRRLREAQATRRLRCQGVDIASQRKAPTFGGAPGCHK